MELGHLQLCLDVDDLDESIAFYESLGFEVTLRHARAETGWRNCAYLIEGNLEIFLIEDWWVDAPEWAQTRRTVLCFRGGDVPRLASQAHDKGAAIEGPIPRASSDGHGLAWVRDPGGRSIMLDTAVGEREDWMQSSLFELARAYEADYVERPHPSEKR